MVEPVAYLNKYPDDSTNITRYKPENNYLLSSIPLYTSEKLPPRVKMTKKQLNAFIGWRTTEKLLSPVQLIWGVLELGDYPDEFYEFLSSENRDEKLLLSLANIWEKIDIDNPEETIEIVPEMKWFVRRILPNAGGNMLYCTDEGELTYNNNKEHATKFDTKEEAELWTNPLTEAVRLPVEGE